MAHIRLPLVLLDFLTELAESELSHFFAFLERKTFCAPVVTFCLWTCTDVAGGFLHDLPTFLQGVPSAGSPLRNMFSFGCILAQFIADQGREQQAQGVA